MLIIGIESPSELLSWVAHAVSAVRARGSIGTDTVADTISETADHTKEIANVISSDIVGNTGKSGEHAFAEFLVRCRWELRRCLPSRTDTWAGSSSSVGRVVAGRIDTGRIGILGDLSGEEVEISQGAHGVSVNGNET